VETSQEQGENITQLGQEQREQFEQLRQQEREQFEQEMTAFRELRQITDRQAENIRDLTAAVAKLRPEE
jgi:Spy/CpxP family protein refolding chaperone